MGDGGRSLSVLVLFTVRRMWGLRCALLLFVYARLHGTANAQIALLKLHAAVHARLIADIMQSQQCRLGHALCENHGAFARHAAA